MNSLEIASLINKPHEKILEDIKKQLEDLDENKYCLFDYEKNIYYKIEYNFILCLLMKYDITITLKMIDRIKELETINKPKTKLEIAKELVKELE
jgi:phage regulator Rha-like protein